MENPAPHPAPPDERGGASADRERRRLATVALVGHWHIDLQPGFRRRSDGAGDLVLWRGGRTVYATVFQAGSAEAEEAIARMLESRQEHVRQEFERLEPGLVGHAYLLPERRDGKRYWGLNTWLSSGQSVVCVTFYFESPDDLPWALAAWQSVRCGKEAAERYVN